MDCRLHRSRVRLFRNRCAGRESRLTPPSPSSPFSFSSSSSLCRDVSWFPQIPTSALISAVHDAATSASFTVIIAGEGEEKYKEEATSCCGSRTSRRRCERRSGSRANSEGCRATKRQSRSISTFLAIVNVITLRFLQGFYNRGKRFSDESFEKIRRRRCHILVYEHVDADTP